MSLRLILSLIVFALFFSAIAEASDKSTRSRQISKTKAKKEVETRAALADPRLAGNDSKLAFPPEDHLSLVYSNTGRPQLGGLPKFTTSDGKHYFAFAGDSSRIYFTVNPKLQARAEQILQSYSVSWGAIVAVDPRSGRILALAGHSSEEPELGQSVALRATFPAASLFKLVTASAAVERSGLTGNSIISFRGGNYTLSKTNYDPNIRTDRRLMSLEDALGKSCNPVFARVAMNHLTPKLLSQYALNFGFNSVLPFEVSPGVSRFALGEGEYEFARTAAGFGDVTLSPLHAAVIVGALANRGRMMTPYLVDKVVDHLGAVRYESHPIQLRNSVSESTARELLSMMRATTESGTARKYFASPAGLQEVPVAGKTGTLRGNDPEGLYHWFVAAAPEQAPEVAIAALVIDNGKAKLGGTKAGKLFLETYFGEGEDTPILKMARNERVAPVQKRVTTKKRRRA